MIITSTHFIDLSIGHHKGFMTWEDLGKLSETPSFSFLKVHRPQCFQIHERNQKAPLNIKLLYIILSRHPFEKLSTYRNISHGETAAWQHSGAIRLFVLLLLPLFRGECAYSHVCLMAGYL